MLKLLLLDPSMYIFFLPVVKTIPLQNLRNTSKAQALDFFESIIRIGSEVSYTVIVFGVMVILLSPLAELLASQ